MVQINNWSEPINPTQRSVIGQRVGILNKLALTMNFRDDSDILTTHGPICNVNQLFDRSGDPGIGAGGKATTVEEGFLTSYGESIERYALQAADKDRIKTATRRELIDNHNVISLEYVDIYDYDSLPLSSRQVGGLTPDTKIGWTAGTDLVSGNTVYIPSQLVWFVSNETLNPPIPLPTTTNGVAAGPSYPFALLNSILELIERDGMMRTWCRQTSPPSIDLSDHQTIKEFISSNVELPNLQLQAVLYNSIIDLPSVGTALVNTAGEFPMFVIGAAADINGEDALRNAAIESAQGVPYVYDIALDHGLSNVDPTADDNLEQNVLHYALPEQFDEVSFLLDGDQGSLNKGPVGVEEYSVRECLDYCLDRFAEANCRPIAFDLTTRDLHEIGVHVVRVWAPELIPISPSTVLPANHPAFDGEDITDKPHPMP